MNSKRLLQIALCALLSAGITAGAVALDSRRTGAHQLESGLKLARQVASQVEGLALKARVAGEADPVTWATEQLSQGMEPRLVRVSRTQSEEAAERGKETYDLDADSGAFDYQKLILPEEGTGLRVQLALGYEGFLGARSPLAADALAALLFLLCEAALILQTNHRFGFSDTFGIRARIADWVLGAKGQLTRLGTHIREMVRQAQRLAVAAGRSRQLVGELRSRIHSGLTELHDGRKFFEEAEAAAARAEALALSAAIEANRIGGEASRVADMATEIHRCIEIMRAASRKGQATMARMEKSIEPWATDADLAYHAFDDVKGATDELSTHIRSTLDHLVGHARLIQGLNQELGAPAKPQASATASEAPAIQALPDPLPPVVREDEEEEEKPSLLQRLRRRKSA